MADRSFDYSDETSEEDDGILDSDGQDNSDSSNDSTGEIDTVENDEHEILIDEVDDAVDDIDVADAPNSFQGESGEGATSEIIDEVDDGDEGDIEPSESWEDDNSVHKDEDDIPDDEVDDTEAPDPVETIEDSESQPLPDEVDDQDDESDASEHPNDFVDNDSEISIDEMDDETNDNVMVNGHGVPLDDDREPPIDEVDDLDDAGDTSASSSNQSSDDRGLGMPLEPVSNDLDATVDHGAAIGRAQDAQEEPVADATLDELNSSLDTPNDILPHDIKGDSHSGPDVDKSRLSNDEGSAGRDGELVDEPVSASEEGVLRTPHDFVQAADDFLTRSNVPTISGTASWGRDAIIGEEQPPNLEFLPEDATIDNASPSEPHERVADEATDALPSSIAQLEDTDTLLPALDTSDGPAIEDESIVKQSSEEATSASITRVNDAFDESTNASPEIERNMDRIKEVDLAEERTDVSKHAGTFTRLQDDMDNRRERDLNTDRTKAQLDMPKSASDSGVNDDWTEEQKAVLDHVAPLVLSEETLEQLYTNTIDDPRVLEYPADVYGGIASILEHQAERLSMLNKDSQYVRHFYGDLGEEASRLQYSGLTDVAMLNDPDKLHDNHPGFDLAFNDVHGVEVRGDSKVSLTDRASDYYMRKLDTLIHERSAVEEEPYHPRLFVPHDQVLALHRAIDARFPSFVPEDDGALRLPNPEAEERKRMISESGMASHQYRWIVERCSTGDRIDTTKLKQVITDIRGTEQLLREKIDKLRVKRDRT